MQFTGNLVYLQKKLTIFYKNLPSGIFGLEYTFSVLRRTLFSSHIRDKTAKQ